MREVYQVWCEWDIGLEYELYETEESAIRAAENALVDTGVEETYEELEDDLIGLKILNLHP